jgi:lipopolysaccharide export system permease protein
MVSIVKRYLLREIFKSSAATTLILFVILMSNTLGRLLSEISAGELPAAGLFPVLLGQSVQIFSFLLPLGFFLGVIFAFGQLYKDHELVVLHACGFGYKQLYATLALILIPFFLITLYSGLWLGASALRSAKQIVDEKSHVNEFQQLKVGQFNLSKDKKNVFFMQSMSEDRLEIEKVIIMQKNKQVDAIETAHSGRNKLDEKSGDLFLEVGPGTRYENHPGKLDYKIIQFDKHGILLEKNKRRVSALHKTEKTPGELLASNSRYEHVEFYWRLNPALTLIVLGLLAVPLAWVAPRQGKYGKVGLALLSFILYQNLLGFSREAMERGSLPMWLNFWWVHLLFLGLALLLLKQRTNFSLFSGKEKNG